MLGPTTHRYVVLRVKTKSRPEYTATSGVATGFFALVFVTGNISSRLSAIRQEYEPEYGRKERFGGSRVQIGIRNMAATRFSDSATPTCVKIKSRPKYTATSGLTTTTFLANYSDNS